MAYRNIVFLFGGLGLTVSIVTFMFLFSINLPKIVS